MTDNNSQQVRSLWQQCSNGEWLYVDKSIPNKNNQLDDVRDYIWFVSPATSAFKVKGYRIANQTIEALVEELAGVRQAVVFGLPHELKGNEITIYVELQSNATDCEKLSNVINAKLAGCFGEFVRAENIRFVEQLPDLNCKSVCRKILKSENITLSYAA